MRSTLDQPLVTYLRAQDVTIGARQSQPGAADVRELGHARSIHIHVVHI